MCIIMIIQTKEYLSLAVVCVLSQWILVCNGTHELHDVMWYMQVASWSYYIVVSCLLTAVHLCDHVLECAIA